MLTNIHFVFIDDNLTGMSNLEVLAQLRASVDDDEPMYEPMDVSNDDVPMKDTAKEDTAMEDATMEVTSMEDAPMDDATMDDAPMEDATFYAPMQDVSMEDVPIQALKTITYISRKRSRDENATMVPTSPPRSRSKRSRPSNMDQWTALDNMCKRMGALRLA